MSVSVINRYTFFCSHVHVPKAISTRNYCCKYTCFGEPLPVGLNFTTLIAFSCSGY